MRELTIPPETHGDPRATEMIRVWLAHEDVHVSLLLRRWEDADDSEVDEREAWGNMLAAVGMPKGDPPSTERVNEKARSAIIGRDHPVDFQLSVSRTNEDDPEARPAPAKGGNNQRASLLDRPRLRRHQPCTE